MNRITYTALPQLAPRRRASAATATIVCQFLEPCGAVEDTIIVGGLVLEGGYLIYKFSKGGKQEVGHDYVRDKARAMGGDYCTALKAIMDSARRSADSKLFNDSKATYKQDCRGK